MSELLQRMQDAASAPERAEAKQLLHSFTTADTEGDAFLKERQSAQEAMGVPLGTDGTPLAWARVQVRVDDLKVLLQREGLREEDREGVVGGRRHGARGGVVGGEPAHELVGEQP